MSWLRPALVGPFLLVLCVCSPAAAPPAAAPAQALQPVDVGRTILRLNAEWLCHAEQVSGAVGESSLNKRMSIIDDYLRRHLSHAGLRALYFEKVAGAAPKDRAALIETGARTAGFDVCPLIGLFQWLVEAAPSTCLDRCIKRHRAYEDRGLRAECEHGCRPSDAH
jgi:hypothetical protein